jgi:hypothetical protein
LAALRLITNSNLIACMTGGSADLAPLGIRPDVGQLEAFGNPTDSNRAGTALAPAQQRATVSACAGLLLAHKSARPALSIKPLALDVINTLMKIEPDDSVIRAVLLRLHLSLKQAQLGRSMVCVACSH